jgi:hypothetical protein
MSLLSSLVRFTFQKYGTRKNIGLDVRLRQLYERLIIMYTTRSHKNVTLAPAIIKEQWHVVALARSGTGQERHQRLDRLDQEILLSLLSLPVLLESSLRSLPSLRHDDEDENGSPRRRRQAARLR